MKDHSASGRVAAAEFEERDPFATGRLWSLWEMINFILGGTLQFVKNLEVEVLRFRTYCISGSGTSKLDDADGRRMEKTVSSARAIFSDFKSKQIDYCINDLEMNVKAGAANVDVFSNLSALARSIHVSLDERLYYAYPVHKGGIFREWKKEWEPVYSAFEQAALDIWHGVDCWAMGQDTASVFHMMRVLESGLSWLASDVDLTFTTENWHNIIDQIEKKIRESADALPKGVAKNERMQFLSEAAKEFRYFKDGWRNYVSHNRGIYDEHQARSVMEHVKSFMIILAKQKTASS